MDHLEPQYARLQHVKAELEALLVQQKTKGRFCAVFSPPTPRRMPPVYRCDMKAVIGGKLFQAQRDYYAELGWQSADFTLKEIELFTELASLFDRCEESVHCKGK